MSTVTENNGFEKGIIQQDTTKVLVGEPTPSLAANSISDVSVGTQQSILATSGETSAANMTSAPVHVVQEGEVEVDLVQPSNSPMEALKGTSTTTSAQEHGNSDELVEQQNSMSIIEGGGRAKRAAAALASQKYLGLPEKNDTFVAVKPKYVYKPKIKAKPIKQILPPTPKHYFDPTSRELVATTGLIGKQVCIFWDGEMKYYPALITGFNPVSGYFQAQYLEDSEPRPTYDEDLSTSIWKIYRGPPMKFVNPTPEIPPEALRANPSRKARREDYSDYFDEPPAPKKPPSSTSSKRSKMSYENMVAEAVCQIADARSGATLNQVRRYIEQTFCYWEHESGIL